MQYKVGIATDDGETVSYGHFAHTYKFIIAKVGDNVDILEERKNPFSMIPDPDDPRGIHIHDDGAPEELARLHGVEKYSRLKEMVLNDIDVIVASGGCPTSLMYFTSEGVRILLAPPGTSIKEVLDVIKNVKIEELPPLAVIEDGRVLTDF